MIRDPRSLLNLRDTLGGDLFGIFDRDVLDLDHPNRLLLDLAGVDADDKSFLLVWVWVPSLVNLE
jgi:hypothetical protein